MWRLSFNSNSFLDSVIIGFVYGNLLFDTKYANEEKMSNDDKSDIKFSNKGWYVDIISNTFFKNTNSLSLNSVLKFFISVDNSVTSEFVIVIVFLFEITKRYSSFSDKKLSPSAFDNSKTYPAFTYSSKPIFFGFFKFEFIWYSISSFIFKIWL